MAHHVLVLWVVDQLRGPWRLRVLGWGRRRRQRQRRLTRCRLRLLLLLRLLRWWLRLLAALSGACLLLRHLLRRIGKLLQPEPDLVSVVVTACTKQIDTLRPNAALDWTRQVTKPQAALFGPPPLRSDSRASRSFSGAEGARKLTSLARIASLPGSITIGRTLRVAILRRRSWPIGEVACSCRRGYPLHRRHHDWGRKRGIACSALQ